MGIHTIFGANGTLPLKLGWKHGKHSLTVMGGPFDAWARAEDEFGVCVRAERVPDRRDVHLPIKDFSVPTDPKAVEYALKDTLKAALAGKQVFVGCMGGWGRTGLFLALLAKAVGVKAPVDYVRKHYSNRAVETREQQSYVETFDVVPIQKWLVAQGWKARARKLFRGR